MNEMKHSAPSQQGLPQETLRDCCNTIRDCFCPNRVTHSEPGIEE